MNKYKPNFNDPRILNRIRHAYGFTKAVMSIDESTNWSSRTIDKYYGQQQHKLSQYLRNTLLICTNNNYSKDTGKTKEYKINPYGLNLIRNILLGIEDKTTTALTPSVSQVGPTIDHNSVQHLFDQQVVYQYCLREYGNELKSLDFTYDDKSHRLWNPIQNIKKIYKKPLLAEHGLIYHYDIDTCAPRLLYQYSTRCGNDIYMPNIQKYINDKIDMRNRLAMELETPIHVIKIIINALFCGARIGNSPEFAISQLLDNDRAKVTYLKEDTFIQDLRHEIKTCWQYIEPHTPIRYKNNKKLPMSSKQKWIVYFQLERLVLDSITKYLKQTNNKYFLEHDGFVTINQVNTDELIDHINMDIGYDVKFQLEVHHKDTTTSNP